VNSICKDIKSDETLMSVGKILKQARQKHKVRDLNAIAEELCIKPYLLEALEQGNFESFLSSCYATGFLKNYATYLGLDTKEVVGRYVAEYAGSKECVVLTFPEAEKYNSLPIKSIAGIATICIVIFVGVWTSLDRLDAEEVKETFAPTNLHSSATPPSMESAPHEPAISDDEVRLKANQDVWVRLVEQDGTVFVEKILLRGEDLIASQTRGLSLMTNNAAALSVYVDGIVASALGDEGEIIENITLEQKILAELSMLD